MNFSQLKKLISNYENANKVVLAKAETDLEHLNSPDVFVQLLEEFPTDGAKMQAKMYFASWRTSFFKLLDVSNETYRKLSSTTKNKLSMFYTTASERKYEHLVVELEELYKLRANLTDTAEINYLTAAIVILTAFKTLAEASGTRKIEVQLPQTTLTSVQPITETSAPVFANTSNSSSADNVLLDFGLELDDPMLLVINQPITSHKQLLNRLNNGSAITSVQTLISQLEHMRLCLASDIPLLSYTKSVIDFNQTDIANLNYFIAYLQTCGDKTIKTVLESYIPQTNGKKSTVTALTCLVKNPLTVLLFDIKPELQGFISQKAMNNLIREDNVKGEFPVFILFLTSVEQFTIFQRLAHLVALMSQKLFTQSYAKLGHLSPAQYLMDNHEKRSLFTLNPDLIKWLPSKLKMEFEVHFSPKVLIDKKRAAAQPLVPKTALPPTIKQEATHSSEVKPVSNSAPSDEIETVNTQLQALTIKQLQNKALTKKAKIGEPVHREQQIKSWKEAISALFGDAHNLSIILKLQEQNHFTLAIDYPDLNSYWRVKTNKSSDRVSQLFAEMSWLKKGLIPHLTKLIGASNISINEQHNNIVCTIAWDKPFKHELWLQATKKTINSLKSCSAAYHHGLQKTSTVLEVEKESTGSSVPVIPCKTDETQSTGTSITEDLPSNPQVILKDPTNVKLDIAKAILSHCEANETQNTDMSMTKDSSSNQQVIFEGPANVLSSPAEALPSQQGCEINFSAIQFQHDDALKLFRMGLRARYLCSNLTPNDHVIIRNNEFWRFKLSQHFQSLTREASLLDESVPCTTKFISIAQQEYQGLPDAVIDLFILAKENRLDSENYASVILSLGYKEKSGRSLLHCIRETNSQAVVNDIYQFSLNLTQRINKQNANLFQSELHWAICCNQPYTVIYELLSKENHYQFKQGDYHYMPIHRAVYELAYDAVAAILDNNPSQLLSLDSYNRNAFDIAQKRDDMKMTVLLNRYRDRSVVIPGQGLGFFKLVPQHMNQYNSENHVKYFEKNST